MAAGANQQLIASKLEEADAITNDRSKYNDDEDKENSDGTTDLSEGKMSKVNRNKRGKKNQQLEKQNEQKPVEQEKKRDDGSLVISHEKEGNLDEVGQQTAEEKQVEAARHAEDRLSQQTEETSNRSREEAAMTAEQALASQLNDVAPAQENKPSVEDLQKDLAAASADVDEASELPPVADAAAQAPLAQSNMPASGESWQNGEEPSMGGILNATTEQAAEDSRKAVDDDRNRTILSHGNSSYVGNAKPTYDSPFNSSFQPSDEPASVDPMSAPIQSQAESPAAQSLPPVAPYVTPPSPEPVLQLAPEPQQPQPQNTTLADLDEQNRQAMQSQPEDPRAAVEAALEQGPAPETPPSIPLPPMPDFSTLPPLPPTNDFSSPQSNDLPPDDLGTILPPAPAQNAPATPSNDPGQFRIPGQ